MSVVAEGSTRESPETLVRLDRVSKTYRMGEVDVQALRGLSLSITAGEMVAIMGASGSGKSTALNVIGTLDRPSSGQYFFAGERVEALPEEKLSRLRNLKIGFVFQAFHLLPRETAQSNVELPLVYAGVRPAERRRRALAALARVGLAERARHLPHQLSGGQQQRVSLARSIIQNPSLLLADEPTGALDSATSEQVLELFRDLHQQGLTIVIVTHDPHVAAHTERVITFADGALLSDKRNRSAAPARKTLTAIGAAP